MPPIHGHPVGITARGRHRSVALRLILGTLCGALAFAARDWGNDENATFISFTLIALAGNFYTTVLMEVGTSFFAAERAPGGPLDRAERELTIAAVALIVVLVISYTAQRALIGIYSEDFVRHGDQTFFAFFVWMTAMAALFGIPLVAARLARRLVVAVATVQSGGDPKGGSIQVLTLVCALLAAAISGYLGWQSIGVGIDEACARGTYPFGCG